LQTNRKQRSVSGVRNNTIEHRADSSVEVRLTDPAKDRDVQTAEQATVAYAGGRTQRW
jgi:hypothetical protein